MPTTGEVFLLGMSALNINTLKVTFVQAGRHAVAEDVERG